MEQSLVGSVIRRGHPSTYPWETVGKMERRRPEIAAQKVGPQIGSKSAGRNNLVVSSKRIVE